MHRNACYLKLVKTYRPWSKSFYTKKISLKKINWAGEYLCDQICQNFSRQLISFSKTGHSRSLFSYFHLFNTVDSQKMFILNDSMQTANLWCQRQPLWQLSHNQSSLFFFIFVFSIQLTANNCSLKNRQWLDLNWKPLVLEATTLPTEPHHCPFYLIQKKWSMLEQSPK